MSADLRAAAAEYLGQRRARGYKLRDEGTLLTAFVESLHSRGVQRITVADALGFVQDGPEVSRATHAWRLGVIRTFAAWPRATDPAAAEAIPPGLIRGGYQRVTPYLYSPAQVAQLMAAARNLPERYLADAMYVLIGLLSVTGLRSGEAFGLCVEDFDSSGLVLNVRGKLDRRRLVPLHPSTAEELRAYCGSRTSGPLFVGRAGQRLAPNTAFTPSAAWSPSASSLPSAVRVRPGCTAFDTLWRSIRWSMPTAEVSTSTPELRSCRRSWATRTRSTPTGI